MHKIGEPALKRKRWVVFVIFYCIIIFQLVLFIFLFRVLITPSIPFREHEDRPEAIEQLTAIIAHFRAEASSQDEKYEHITKEDKDKVLNEVEAAQNWLNEQISKQQVLPLTANPVLFTKDLQDRHEYSYFPPSPPPFFPFKTLLLTRGFLFLQEGQLRSHGKANFEQAQAQACARSCSCPRPHPRPCFRRDSQFNPCQREWWRIALCWPRPPRPRKLLRDTYQAQCFSNGFGLEARARLLNKQQTNKQKKK